MASLTPLSKGLLSLAILGGMASAVWHLGLKEKLSSANPTTTASSPSASTPPANVPQSAVVTAPPPAVPAGNKTSTAESAEIGRKLLDKGDYAQARPHLESAVQGGDAGSACHLGEMTLKGQGGISANQEKAAALFQLAQSRGAICFASGK